MGLIGVRPAHKVSPIGDGRQSAHMPCKVDKSIPAFGDYDSPQAGLSDEVVCHVRDGVLFKYGVIARKSFIQ